MPFFVRTYVVQGATFTVVSRKKVGKVLHIELNHEGEWMDLEQSSRVGRKLSGLFSCCGGGGSSGAKSKAKKQAPAHGKGDDPGSKYSEEQTPDGAVVPKVSFDPVVQTDDGNSQLDGGTLTDVAWNRHKDPSSEEDEEDEDEEVVGMGAFDSAPVAGEGLEEDGDGKREERVEGNEGGEEEAMTREELVAMMEGQGLDAEQMAAVLERYGD